MGAQAGTIVEKLAEHLADSDAAVRAALRELWRDVVLPGLGPAGLAPFLPLVMAHVTSAMTHLSAPVRYAHSRCELMPFRFQLQ